MPVTAQEGVTAEAAEVRMTLVDGLRGFEARATLTAAAGPGTATAPQNESQSLLLILALALLGGLILNLMPCVLPVLSLKLMSLVAHGNSPPAAVRLSFFATAAGIVFSFLLLAAGTVALKQAGAAVGWGIQFQQPLFLAAMAVMVTLFAANLFGFFEILLPGSLTDQASKTTTRGLAGAFATGAFATLLATPCSAPFLGTAVGFALARGTIEILLIFAALGVGLALPYLAVVAWPRLAGLLPRPGRWMIWLRLLLGLALLATALWLLSVLAVQVSRSRALILGLLLAMLLALFAYKHFRQPRRWVFNGAAAVVVAAALGSVAVATPELAVPRHEAERRAESHWQAFERDQIEKAVAAGRTVLVDVTADWCITCQVNKARVLESEAIESLLREDSVTALRADWTRADAAIADYLAAHGRYGIPFNAVYGPAAPEGILLPELLSQDAVREAIAAAAGKKS